jgi:regulator of replication initiation timing
MDEMIALYQASIQQLQRQLQGVEASNQELQSTLNALQNQTVRLDTELESLRVENDCIRLENQNLQTVIPVEIHLPTLICREEECAQDAHRSGICFEHYRTRALQGGSLL